MRFADGATDGPCSLPLMADSIQYVYAVVDPDTPFAAAPAGIDDLPVRVEREGSVAALVSTVDGRAYSPAEVEARTADIAWLGPRARAHDAVVTWASDQAAVVPLPMFSLFRDADGVRAMLRDREKELQRTLGRVRDRQEFSVRVFRIDGVLASHLGQLSPRIAELERAASAASPGQRYLLVRKLETERTSEVARLGSDVAQRVYDSLAAKADDTAIEPVPRHPAEGTVGTAVLNASFLLERAATEPFRRALTDLMEEHEPRGFRFEFTGPWPPYHFVRDHP